MQRQFNLKAIRQGVVALCCFGSVQIHAAPCTSQALQGAWQLQSATYTDKDGKVVGRIRDGSTLSRKLISGQYLAFHTWQPSGEFDVAASGVFRLEQGLYIEQLDTASKPSLVQKTYRFQCQLQGDAWLHSGDEDGIHIEEVWRKVSK